MHVFTSFTIFFSFMHQLSLWGISQRHSKNQEHMSSLLALQVLFAVRTRQSIRDVPTGEPVNTWPRRRRPARRLVETCALLVLLSSPEPIHPAERVKGEERFGYSREQERCWSGARAAAVHSLDNSLAVPSRRPELQRQRPPDCNQPRRGVVFVCFIEKEIKDKG